ncbi:MAG: HEPN domain-containing protein [Deltaproteobacteria bacterium]|nr:HEPN domain-containing protein [Deltaproteobacteria bacterium]
MNNHETRSAVVGYWFEKPEESLKSAKREFEAGSVSFAMNRLYYAAFYAVSTLLMAHNLSFKKHSGVRAAFHQKFIKPGLVERRWGRFYDQLFEDRQEGDYVVFISFEPAYVESKMNECAQFIECVRPLIFEQLQC